MLKTRLLPLQGLEMCGFIAIYCIISIIFLNKTVNSMTDFLLKFKLDAHIYQGCIKYFLICFDLYCNL